MAKGRKRKVGKRTKSGRLSRAGGTPFDKGTERVQAMQELYGQNGCDAIGRAYETGLLGNGSDAKAMLDMARQVSNGYWAAYSNGGYICAIGRSINSGNSLISPEQARRSEEWLKGQLGTVDAFGHAVRRVFDQLVIDVNPDCGPDWLDRICLAKQNKLPFDPADATSLRTALKALAAISDVSLPVLKEAA